MKPEDRKEANRAVAEIAGSIAFLVMLGLTVLLMLAM